MKIAAFGLECTGAASATCLAELDHDVIHARLREHKAEAAQSGECALIGPGPSDLLKADAEADRLTAMPATAEAIVRSPADISRLMASEGGSAPGM